MGEYITDSKVLTIKLTSGWKEGTKITFEKEGSERPGYEAANIVFIIKVTRWFNLLFTSAFSKSPMIIGSEKKMI